MLKIDNVPAPTLLTETYDVCATDGRGGPRAERYFSDHGHSCHDRITYGHYSVVKWEALTAPQMYQRSYSRNGRMEGL